MALPLPLIVDFNKITFLVPEKELGSGAYGKVLQAMFQGNPVAVKLLHTKFKKEFIQSEAIMLTRCRHQNIVRFHGAFYGLKNGIVLELMKGGSLSDLLHRYTHVKYSYCHVGNWSRQILRGLSYLHGQNVIHRDLKPLNMLLSGHFLTLKLSDFGTVREINSTMSSFRGTMVYMAPEVSTKKYDHTCGIYSFGIVLWELMARKSPHRVKNVELSEITKCPEQIQELIESCWSETPNERPTISTLGYVIRPISCTNCQNSCTPLIDSLTKKQAFANQLKVQKDEAKYFFPPKAIDHSPPQNETRANTSKKPEDSLLLNEIDDVNIVERNRLIFICENSRAGWPREVEKIESLLDNGADINATDKNGWTPLHHTCENGHLGMSKLLVNRGADVNAKNKNGWTPLRIACKNGHFEVAKLLLENGADINVTDKNGWTPLHHTYMDREMVEFLLNRGANVNVDVKNESFWTPLHVACMRKKFEIAEILLDNGADINATDKDGMTLLHIFCLQNHTETVEFLLNRDASVNVVDKNSWTPLHIACCCGHFQIIELLLNKGADVTIKNNNGEIPGYLIDKKSMAREFLELINKLKVAND